MAFAFWLQLDVIALFNTESGGLQQAAFKQSPIEIDLIWNGIIAAAWQADRASRLLILSGV